MRKSVLVVPDLHAPYQHVDAFRFLKKVARSLQPDEVVVIGDEIDANSLSRYPADPDLHSPEGELAAAVKALQPLYRMFPRARVCVSNHTHRPFKRAFAAGMPSRMLRHIRDVLEAPEGWQWADSWVVDDVMYVHGDGFGGQNAPRVAAERHRRSVVMGHVHSNAGVHWMSSMRDSIFGMAVGALIDADSPVFAYAKYQARRPVLGCGVIEGGVPRFIPLEV